MRSARLLTGDTTRLTTLPCRISVRGAGDCNGVRMINGLSEQLAGRPGWRTFGYPLVCPEAR